MANRRTKPDVPRSRPAATQPPVPRTNCIRGRFWLSTEDGTRTDGFLEDRAAVYLPDQHLLQINRDFWVFKDMIDDCCKDLADYPGAKDLAAAMVRPWYEQALVETVIGVRALTNRKEWSNRDVDRALSAEALTAAAMQRYHVAVAAKDDL